MVETYARVGRNVLVYVVGVAMAIAGALGLAQAIVLNPFASVVLLLVGLGLVIAVHEWLDGPF